MDSHSGREPHVTAVVEALAEQEVVEKLLEVEVRVGRAVLVERQHGDDRAEQLREVDASSRRFPSED